MATYHTAQFIAQPPKRNRRPRRRVWPWLIALGVGLALVWAAVVFVPILRMKHAASPFSEAQAAPPEAVFSLPMGAATPEAEGALETLRGMRDAHPELDAILANPEGYPTRLIELAARNPETIPFVLGYAGHTVPAAPADISPELAAGGVPAFYQWDGRWGYGAYAGGMVGLDGCGPVCLSMAAVALTGNAELDPLSVARFADGAGHSDPTYGTAWSLMSEGAGQLGLTARELPLGESFIRETLQTGGLVILSLRPGDFTTTGHFVLVAGFSADGGFTLHDPNSMANTAASWPYERLEPQIKNLWALSAQ